MEIAYLLWCGTQSTRDLGTTYYCVQLITSCLRVAERVNLPVLPRPVLLDFVAFRYVTSPSPEKLLRMLWWDQSFIHFGVPCCLSASGCSWVLALEVLLCVLCRAPVGHLQYYLTIIAGFSNYFKKGVVAATISGVPGHAVIHLNTVDSGQGARAGVDGAGSVQGAESRAGPRGCACPAEGQRSACFNCNYFLWFSYRKAMCVLNFSFRFDEVDSSPG